MLVGMILGFACCWLVSGGIVMRAALDDDDLRALNVADDAVPILFGMIIWPWMLLRDDGDA